VERPLLFLDVDGVLNPYPDTPAGYAEYRFFPEDNEPVRLCADHAGWLRELGERLEIVWASGWGVAANELICPTLGLPRFPVVALPSGVFDQREKVPPVAAYAGERAVAWLDDIVTDEARAWAAGRSAPTLLVEVPAREGLTRSLVDRVQTWATSLG
jgi:hypothetical protein